MGMTRLEQLSEMCAGILEISREDARNMIVHTSAGQQIVQGNSAYLFEQHTDNLLSIAAELPRELGERFTADAVRQAMRALQYPSVEAAVLKIEAIPRVGMKLRKARSWMKQERRAQLRQDAGMMLEIRKQMRGERER